MKNHVIIGNSGAAINAIRAIRSINNEDKITLISKENCVAYSPVLITYYLKGNIPYERLFFCNNDFYRLNKIDTFLGMECAGIDTKIKTVSLKNGPSIKYDKLLVSTGSSSFIPKSLNTNFSNILTARTINDAKMLKLAINEANNITIIGSGLVGSQIANAVIHNNKKIIIIEKLPNIMTGILDEKAANIIQNSMRSNKIDLFLNDGVLEIDRKKESSKMNKISLLLSSGKQLETDVVIFATGIIPNVEFLKNSDLKVSKGILINKNMQTNINDIYAAGDVSENINTITGKNNINPTWLNAMRQGWTAGLNMADKKISLSSNIRANISNIFGFHIVSIGTIIKENENFQEIVHFKNKYYKKLVFNNGFLVGLLIVTETKEELPEIGAIINLIEKGKIRYENFQTDFNSQQSLFRLFAKEFYYLKRN